MNESYERDMNTRMNDSFIYMNESCEHDMNTRTNAWHSYEWLVHSYEWVIWARYEHSYEWLVHSYEWVTYIHMNESYERDMNTRMNDSYIHMNESHTFIWMSHMNTIWTLVWMTRIFIWMSHVNTIWTLVRMPDTRMNDSYIHMNESYTLIIWYDYEHSYEWVLPSYEWVMSHMNESEHSYEGLISHVNEWYTPIHMWHDSFLIWMSHTPALTCDTTHFSYEWVVIWSWAHMWMHQVSLCEWVMSWRVRSLKRVTSPIWMSRVTNTNKLYTNMTNKTWVAYE